MPTIFSESGFRFFFYSKDINERPHIHVENADGEVKIWLDTFKAVRSAGNMSGRDTRKATKIIKQRYKEIMIKWEEMLKTGGRL